MGNKELFAAAAKRETGDKYVKHPRTTKKRVVKLHSLGNPHFRHFLDTIGSKVVVFSDLYEKSPQARVFFVGNLIEVSWKVSSWRVERCAKLVHRALWGRSQHF